MITIMTSVSINLDEKAGGWESWPEDQVVVEAVRHQQDWVRRQEEGQPHRHLLHDWPDQLHEGCRESYIHHCDQHQERDCQNNIGLQESLSFLDYWTDSLLISRFGFGGFNEKPIPPFDVFHTDGRQFDFVHIQSMTDDDQEVTNDQ